MAIVNTKTKVYDMMMHPDREAYEIEYYSKVGGELKFELIDSTNKLIKTIKADNNLQLSTLSFDDKDILKGKNYTLRMTHQQILKSASLLTCDKKPTIIDS